MVVGVAESVRGDAYVATGTVFSLCSAEVANEAILGPIKI
ncbi:hypothetical protein COLO4_35610 [Corchorus olitorius]|uniref:Uncharacterized protein n=1 Tax=Corchorus olitorius TaxID=93759 RepID=A0A1R3GEQ3_9ROSI|nr:hypothetical protein COLO4_35610 [Corchorus olitorius]